MIGPLEIAIIAVVLLVIFGWRYLPSIGRRAGEGAKDLKESVQEMVGDKADPKTLGKSAGKGLREAREFRDALTGKTVAEPQPSSPEPPTAANPEAPAQRSDEADAADSPPASADRPPPG